MVPGTICAHYTNTLRPRIGGVPTLIIVTWSVLMYSAFMLIDWLVGMKGEKRVRSWWGKGLWAILIPAASATLVCAWDLMVDPFATSRVWMDAVHKAPWWYLSLIHISEPTRLGMISYAVFCLKKKKTIEHKNTHNPNICLQQTNTNKQTKTN